MKILVYLKQVPHQDARLDVSGDGTWIKEENIKFEINSYDSYALEEALKIKDQDATSEVIVVSAGPERVVQALRQALGMGADRAIHVRDDSVDATDALGLAKTLANVAKAEKPDVIFMGFMSDDGNFAAIAPMVAELFGVPHATAVIALTRNGDTFIAERELEGGNLEVVELKAPCLIAVQTGINQVRYASLKGIMQAKKKPVDPKSAGDLGVAGQLAAKVAIEKIYVPAKSATAEILQGSADEIAEKLVAKIKELGLL